MGDLWQMETLKRLNIKLDLSTHRKLKSKAAADGKTLQEQVVHLIKSWVYQGNGR